jgi:phage-related protein
MSQAMPLPTRISQGATKRVKQRILQARFGDGYFQTAPDGINSIYEEWDIQWENLTLAERTTVVTAIYAVGATDYLTWTPPGDSVQKKYQIIPDATAELYEEQLYSGQYYTIRTRLVQVR